MKVIATNLSVRRTVEFLGKAHETGFFKEPQEDGIYLTLLGVRGDCVVDSKHHGGADKAVYAYNKDYYSFWQEFYADIDWSGAVFGENLTISGMGESKMFIGDEFQLGEAIVRVSQPRQPCFKLGLRFQDQKIIKHFIKENKPGVYFKVLKEGWVKPGDELRIKTKSNSKYSILDIYSLLFHDKNLKEIKNAAEEPLLAESCRNDLLKRL